MTWKTWLAHGQELVIDGRVAIRAEADAQGRVTLFADDVPGAEPVKFQKRPSTRKRGPDGRS